MSMTNQEILSAFEVIAEKLGWPELQEGHERVRFTPSGDCWICEVGGADEADPLWEFQHELGDYEASSIIIRWLGDLLMEKGYRFHEGSWLRPGKCLKIAARWHYEAGRPSALFAAAHDYLEKREGNDEQDAAEGAKGTIEGTEV